MWKGVSSAAIVIICMLVCVKVFNSADSATEIDASYLLTYSTIIANQMEFSGSKQQRPQALTGLSHINQTGAALPMLQNLFLEAELEKPTGEMMESPVFSLTHKWQLRQDLWVEPEFFLVMHSVNPLMERLISHHAYMLGRQLGNLEVNELQRSEIVSYQYAIAATCEACLKAVLFYEKSIAGRTLNVQETREVLYQETFKQLEESAQEDDYIITLFSDSEKLN